MNLKEYETNVAEIKELLQEIRDEGVFAYDMGGIVDASIYREYAPTHTRRIPKNAASFLRLAVLRRVDRLSLQLLRKAEECGVDVIDDLLKALPKAYPSYANLMQVPLEHFMEGELK